MSTRKAGESGSYLLHRSGQRLSPRAWMQQDVMSVHPDARTAGPFLAHRQNQDSSVRPETSTLGTNAIREDALARLCPTSNGRPRQIEIAGSDHHMDHRDRLRAKFSAEFNSCLLGPQRLKHFAILM